MTVPDPTSDSQMPTAEPSPTFPSMAWLMSWPWFGWAIFAFGVSAILLGFPGFLLMVTAHYPDHLQLFANSLAGISILVLVGCLTFSLAAKIGGYGNKDANRTWSRRGLVAFGLGLAAMMGSLIIPSIHSAQQVASLREKSNEWIEHSTGQEHLVIGVPGNWESRPDLIEDPGVTLCLEDRWFEVYLTVTGIPKDEATWRSAEEFQQYQLSNFQLSDVEVHTGERVSEDKLVYLDSTIVGLVNETDRFMVRMRHLRLKNVWVDVRIWGEASTMDDLKDTIEQIINSLHVRSEPST